MAYYPYSPQTDAKYIILGPGGARCTFNDPLDPDNVGVLEEVTGLDSAPVRESMEELSQADGASAGDFFFNARTISLKGKVVGHTSALDRDTKLAKFRRATNALRGDLTLQWQNKPTASTVGMQTWCRLQNRSVTGGWTKEFQVGLVAEYAPLFSQTLNSLAGSGVTVENRGDWDAWPLLTITGASTNPTVTINPDTAGVSDFVLYTGPTGNTLTLTASESIQIDTLAHTAVFTAGARAGQSANRYINFATTARWPRLIMGNSVITLAGGGTLLTEWRDTWA